MTFDRLNGKAFIVYPEYGTHLHVPLDDKIYNILLFSGQNGLIKNRIYNIYIAAPGGRYLYTTKTDNFEYKLDYSFMPDSETFEKWVTLWQLKWKIPYFAAISLPGTFGSDGPISLHQDKKAVRLLSTAMDQIQSATGATSFNISGVSAAGPVIAGLVAERRDVISAVIASAPFDLQSELRYRGIPRPYSSPDDPIDGSQFATAVARSRTKILLIADHRDRTVPYQQSVMFARTVRKAGGLVDIEDATGSGPDHHFLVEYAVARMLQIYLGQQPSSGRGALK